MAGFVVRNRNIDILTVWGKPQIFLYTMGVYSSFEIARCQALFFLYFILRKSFHLAYPHPIYLFLG